MPLRLAIALLMAGFALLNIANAHWAHAIGIGCLFGFGLLGVCAVMFTALAGERPTSG
jgi:hypothetical protein